MSYVKKNFKICDLVKIVNFPEGNIANGKVGTIVGKANENVLDVYIVLFQEPIDEREEWLAWTITEACLEKVGEV